MADVAISKTQKRAARLLAIEIGGSYESAKLAFLTVGICGDAIPAGCTWRDVAKMNDEQFISALKSSSSLRSYEITAQLLSINPNARISKDAASAISDSVIDRY
jgi:hypothetical protein